MTNILEIIKSKFPNTEEFKSDAGKKSVLDGLCITVAAEDVYGLCEHIAREPEIQCDFINFITAVDWPAEGKFELVYCFYSVAKKHTLWIKSFLARDSACVSSITPLYPGADWQEREIYDLFGIEFIGHPNPRRILLWEGYKGYPLRKDYVHVADKYDSGDEIGITK